MEPTAHVSVPSDPQLQLLGAKTVVGAMHLCVSGGSKSGKTGGGRFEGKADSLI